MKGMNQKKQKKRSTNNEGKEMKGEAQKKLEDKDCKTLGRENKM